MFVDNSGRRSRLLRRIGLLVGAVCFGYAVVLGMAFMGLGTSINPSSLVPFGAGGGSGAGPGGQGGNGPAGYAPQGGLGNGAGRPGGTPSPLPTSTATPTATTN